MKTRITIYLFLTTMVLFGQTPKSPYPIIFVHGICSNYRIWTEGDNNIKDFLESKGLHYGDNLNVTLDYSRNYSRLMDSKEVDVHLFTTNPAVGDFYTINFATHSSGYSNESDVDFPYRPESLILSLDATETTINFVYPKFIGQYFIGDILRIDDEFLLVLETTSTTLLVLRGILGSEPASHLGNIAKVWNLSSQSNQASISKQGWGLKKAIDAIKTVTGKSKVILVGHSMGGLSCREYIQSSYYQQDVAKLITIGTPHLGSNADITNTFYTGNPLLDDRQDAMRDLRYSHETFLGYAPDPPYGDFPDNGVYLFGGMEPQSLNNYYSTDFNGNGIIDNSPIIGLSKNISQLPNSIAYCWAVSQWGLFGTDIAVRCDRQYPWDETGTTGQVLIGDTLFTHTIHTDEPKDLYTLIRGLDEPDDYSLDYKLGFDTTYWGTITYQTNFSPGDIDYFRVNLPMGGNLKFTVDGPLSGVNGYILLDADGNYKASGEISTFPFTFSRDLAIGTYHFGLIGNANSTTWENPYKITPTFIQLNSNNVLLLSPNGGESWGVNSIHNIQWSSDNVTNVNLEYSTDNGTSWNSIIASTSGSSGSYPWTVPNTLSPNCKVKISNASDASIYDISNNTFTISNNNNPIVSNVTFSKTGTTVTVHYNVTDAEQSTLTINMEVSSDGGATWDYNYGTATGDIGNNIGIGNNKTITWTYSGAYNNQFIIKIIANDLVVDGGACATPTVIYSGKTYHTVQIGSQCWLKENLDVGTMIDSMANQTNNGIIEKYCYWNNPANCTTYGGLYQWNEAMQYVTTPGTKGICPTGWHIPTLTEFQILSTAVGGNGNSLKAVGQGTGGGAGTNTSGFSTLLAGSRYSSGYFYYLGILTYFWSSSVSNATYAYSMNLVDISSGIFFFEDNREVYGSSVRCVKD